MHTCCRNPFKAMQDNTTNTTKDIQHERRLASRAPRRREQDLSGIDMAHITESLEESIASYEHPGYTPHTAAPDTQYQSGFVPGGLNANAAARHTSTPLHSSQQLPESEAAASRNGYSYTPNPESEHYEAELANMQAIREARAKRMEAHNSQSRPGDKQTAESLSRETFAEANAQNAGAKQSGLGQDGKNAVHSANSAQSVQKTGSGGHDKSGGKEKKRKHPVLKLLLLLLVLGLGFIGYKFITGQSGYYTVAVFGVDSRNGNVNKEALSDVNIICRIDRASGEIKLVSLYRDTYSEINSDGTYHKLNEAYFRGGPEQAVWAVEHNTDVKVDDYATFNWKAVADSINILGGVDLEISDAEFKYINAFITETVNSTGIGSYQLDHAGMNHLDGVQAVAYARLRLMDTDFQRTERQRKVIGLALEKAKSADYATLLNIVTTVMPQISTSVTPDDLIPFMKGVSKYYIAETAGFPFDKTTQDVGKLDCVIPVTLESNAVKLHEFLYPDTPYSPSSGLKEISDHIINVTGLSG